MSNRGTQDAPNTRHPDRPPRKPSRLDQFADDLASKNSEFGVNLEVTNRDDAKAMQHQDQKQQ